MTRGRAAQLGEHLEQAVVGVATGAGVTGVGQGRPGDAARPELGVEVDELEVDRLGEEDGLGGVLRR